MQDAMSFEEVDVVCTAAGFEAQDGGWVAAARHVLATNTFAMVEGSILDQFSASAMIQVFDALSERNRVKLAAMPMVLAHDMVFKILDRVR